jgi:hypothetical protein
VGVLSFDGVDDWAQAATLTQVVKDIPNGAYTIAYVFRRTSTGTFDGIGYLSAAGVALVGCSFDSASDLNSDTPNAPGAASNSSVDLTQTTDTNIVVLSKPAGSSVVTYRWKKEPAGGWSSQASPGPEIAEADATALDIANWVGGDFWAMKLGLIGIWDVALSQTDAEALDDNWRTSDWWTNAGGQPKCLVELNTLTPVDLAGNATAWTVSGATLDGAETLDAWNFDGTGAPAPAPSVNPGYSQFPRFLRSGRMPV